MNGSDQINLPEVLAEITALFHAYEAAFMRNDVAALNNYFWNDAALTRYGTKSLGDRDTLHYPSCASTLTYN